MTLALRRIFGGSSHSLMTICSRSGRNVHSSYNTNSQIAARYRLCAEFRKGQYGVYSSFHPSHSLEYLARPSSGSRLRHAFMKVNIVCSAVDEGMPEDLLEGYQLKP
jgi:hypothetical protein